MTNLIQLHAERRRLKRNGVLYHLGYFIDIKDAISTRDKWLCDYAKDVRHELAMAAVGE